MRWPESSSWEWKRKYQNILKIYEYERINNFNKTNVVSTATINQNYDNNYDYFTLKTLPNVAEAQNS